MNFEAIPYGVIDEEVVNASRSGGAVSSAGSGATVAEHRDAVFVHDVHK